MNGRISVVGIVCTGVLLVGSVVAEMAVTDVPSLRVDANSIGLAPTTEHGATDALPDVGTPIFRFDCTQTNGWTFTDGRVTKIPSLVGDRFLSTSREGGLWGNAYTVTGPEYVLDEELGGRPALDFGARKSSRGLIFNPDASTIGATTSVGSNVLQNIATAFFVYGSQKGGGWLFSGGYGDNLGGSHHDAAGYHWHRGASRNELVNTDQNFEFNDPIIRDPGYYPAVNGTAWQDGWAISPKQVGFNGAWQVISFMPTNELGRATGLGFNDGRWNNRSGGLKIAEFIVYDHHLTDVQRRKVEAYLQKKWFNRESRGMNGNARLGLLHAHWNTTCNTTTGGVQVVVNAAPDETLTVERLKGGRVANSAVTVTGGGALALGDAENYNGTIRLVGGTLKLTARAVPSEPPTNALVHLDATAANAFETTEVNETNFVSRWRNLSDRIVNGNKLLYARSAQSDTSKMPYIRPEGMGTGLPIVDFGALNSGAFLKFETNNAKTVSLYGIATVLALVGAQNGGGHLVGNNNGGNYFMRNGNSPTTYTDGLIRAQVNGQHITLNGTNGVVYLDGRRSASANGYLHAGYQVVAMRTPGSTINRIGSYTDSYTGALRLGEIMIYDRVLTDEEFADAQAYLMRKWMGRTAPGYAHPVGEKVPDVQQVLVTAPSKIDVPAGQTVRIGTLTLRAPLTLTGGGTLDVESAVSLDEFLEIDSGVVKVVGRPPVTADCQLAAAPSFHVDASQTNTLETLEQNGTNFVKHWYDTSFRTLASKYTARMPWVNTNEEARCNGHPTVDFGPFGSKGAMLAFGRPLDSVRAIYVVWSAPGGGFFLGSTGAMNGNYGGTGSFYDFHRGTDGSNGFSADSPLFYNNAMVAHVSEGEIYVNGSLTNRLYKPTDAFQLVEVHPRGGAHASAFACDRDFGDRYGGQRIAEAVLYERVLSEREKVATRNYLMQKWFNRESQALPSETVVDENPPLGAIVVEDTRTFEAADGVKARAVLGAGVLEKTGAGTLTVGDLSGFTGTVQVAAGTLCVTGDAPVVDAVLVTDGIIYHADAEHGVEVVTNELGDVRVTKWTSRHDATWSVVPGQSAASGRPTYMQWGLNGLPAVDMVYGGKGGDGYQYLRFRHNDAYAHVGNIRSIFWVLGSHNGGGYLMGGGTNQYASASHYNFHRGLLATKDSWDDTRSAANRLLGGPAHKDAREAGWWMNGKSVNPQSASLSGGWDQLSMVLKGGYTDAEGFAFDGRTITDGVYLNRSGGQRLAEVVIYDRSLTDAERLQMETYLRSRWGLGVHASAENAASVDLAAAAVLDLSGSTQYVASVTGGGTVRNGTLVPGALVADAAATAWPTVTAALAFQAPQEIELRNLPDNQKHLWIPVLVPSSNVTLPSTVFTGDEVHPGYGAHLRLRDGVLGVEINGLGTQILFR